MFSSDSRFPDSRFPDSRFPDSRFSDPHFSDPRFPDPRRHFILQPFSLPDSNLSAARLLRGHTGRDRFG